MKTVFILTAERLDFFICSILSIGLSAVNVDSFVDRLNTLVEMGLFMDLLRAIIDKSLMTKLEKNDDWFG